MKKTVLMLAFGLIAACASSQTLFSPSQMAVKTNDFPGLPANGDLRTMLQYLSGSLASNIVQSGTCTNNQTNVFAVVFKATPVVAASWGYEMTNGVLSIKSVTPSNCVIGSSVATNGIINWIAK